jgi:hypothetical protein
MMWLLLVAAMSVPAMGLLTGVVTWRRDFFALLMYGQALVYVYVAPALAARDVPAATQSQYVYFMAAAAAMFMAPFLGIYRVSLRRRARRAAAAEPLHVRTAPAAFLVGGTVVLAVGYLFVALTRGLLYRRLGHEGLAAAQLDLTLVEFAFYRTFIEAAPFLTILYLLGGRVARFPSQAVRALWRVGLASVSLCYGLHVLVNSRLYGLLFLGAVYGIRLVSDAKPRAFRPERLALAFVALFAGFYVLQVTQNVRGRIANGGSAFDVQNLVPAGAPDDGDLGSEWRLNGIDLMALIADRVDAEGPALGKAWAVPLVVSLDPIVRTPFTEQLKRAALTSAKSYLLLSYAGIALPDYYNCMLTDAYGNFGVPGFLLVAGVLGVLVAYCTDAMTRCRRPATVILACFVLSRLLPFEQEFAMLLFGWFKLVPFVGGLLLLNPFGAAAPPGRLRGPAPERRLLAPGAAGGLPAPA